MSASGHASRPDAMHGLRIRVVAIVMGLLITGSAAVAQEQGSTIDALVRRHAAGEPVLAEAVPNQAGLTLLRPQLFAAARTWRQPWNPAGATFLLDLAIWSLVREWTDGFLLLRTAEEIVTGRQTPPTARLDAFERLFHRTALVGLISTNNLVQAEDYFGRVDARLAAGETTHGTAASVVEPQLLLLRGLLDEAWTAPMMRSGTTGSTAVSSAAAAPGDRSLRTKLEQALASFERASHAEEVAAEAAVRRAFVLHRLGRHQEALAALDAIATAPLERTVQYWRYLFRGRVLEALDRIEDAAAAYAAAAGTEPGAQTPAVALASLFQRHGHPEQAQQWAARARATDASVLDPWWQYWFGDLRWLNEWMTELRRAAAAS